MRLWLPRNGALQAAAGLFLWGCGLICDLRLARLGGFSRRSRRQHRGIGVALLLKVSVFDLQLVFCLCSKEVQQLADEFCFMLGVAC